jgi:phospholipase/carboxylesterase
MDAEAFEGRALSYVLVRPDNYSPDGGWPLVVMLHGFGANMYDLAGLSPSIDESGYVYAFPNGPLRVPFGNGQFGYSWLEREGVEPPPPDAPEIEERLDSFVADVKKRTGVDDGEIVLGGFSQGAGLALRYGLPRRETFAGIAVLSGFTRDLNLLESRLPRQRTQPVFVVHGTDDRVVPVERGRETRSWLEKQDYAPEYHEYPMMAHEINAAVIRDLQPWLKKVLPPRLRR